MVHEIDRKLLMFKTKEIWFSQKPYDITKYDYVMFRACKEKSMLKGFRANIFTTLTIDLTQDQDKIWQDMKKKSCRYFINRAMKSGVIIKRNENYEKFFEMNTEFRKKKGLTLTSETIDFWKAHFTLFTAEYNQELIGGQLFIEDNVNIRWYIGSSKRLQVNKEMAILISSANRLMLWEAIKYAKQKGLKEFDFGGYYTGKAPDRQKEQINVFKASFGGKFTIHYIYEKYYSMIYYLIAKLNNMFELLVLKSIVMQKIAVVLEKIIKIFLHIRGY